ncbi:MAG: riboflavin synthase [Acidobacteriota bacterium]|nr:MAG: riboflavin synthase [Acidobacteriota bacterium]
MFTGIIEELGTVRSLTEIPGGLRIEIAADTVTQDTQAGDSIAVNGVCLTALDPSNAGFAADVSPETLERTTLGRLSAGSRVNLERALLPTTRLSGHIVQGHVDGRGEFAGAVAKGGFYTVTIRFPDELSRYFVEKGSVSVEGISLTIASLRDSKFDIAIIPKTWEITNLHTVQPGDAVNLEVDVIAKYVERMMQGR